MWTYLMPFFLFLKPTPFFIRILFKWCWVYVWFALGFCLYNFSDFYLNPVEVMRSMIGWDAYYVNRPQEPCNFVLPCCAFLFYFLSFSKKQKILLVFTVTLALGAALMAGRRSSAATVLCFVLTASCYFYFKSNKKIKIILILLSLIGIVTYYVDLNIWEEKFEFLLERIDSDTRSGVETDFFKDMTTLSDWIFGRGMSGTYLSPSAAVIDKLHRTGIETGYLNLILHGGICLLAPYVLLMSKAVYCGLFSSCNLLCKVCATYIGFHIFFLYPSGTPYLSMEYLMLYLFIALCNSKTWLNRTNDEIRQRIYF